MAPPKFSKAIKAMASYGFPEETVRPVLQDLLKSCKRQWALIEDSNYATLVDAILESEQKHKEAGNELMILSDDESEDIAPLVRRSKLKCQASQCSTPASSTFIVSEETASEAEQNIQDMELSSHDNHKIICSATEQASPLRDIWCFGTKKRRCARKSRPILEPIMESNLLLDHEYNDFMIDVCPSPKEKFPVPLAEILPDGFNNFLDEDCSRPSGTNLLLEVIKKDEVFDALPSPPCEEGVIKGKGQLDGRSNEPGNGSSTPSHSMIIRDENLYFVEDITKGLEEQYTSLINEVNSEKLPTFIYMPKSCEAQLKFPLVDISVNDCCSSCSGDCLSLETPCPCAKKSGGEFAYRTGGVVKDGFIDECISLNRKSPQQKLSFCEVCPLERSKETLTGQCKGHVIRKFIKECWYKCGCSKDCGNRAVQRGITVKLQVFMTKEGKGWGLRTLEDLPRGAFICEYVGEIITSIELADRKMKNMDMQQQSYNVILDADWRSDGGLKDEEVLCLDGASYGNVARFINHRCLDANMIEIPVEAETPKHHYYHVAFFTTREVKAQEELTWDYGINFGDDSQSRKAFECRCGSNFCRGKNIVKTSEVSAREPSSAHRESAQTAVIKYYTRRRYRS